MELAVADAEAAVIAIDGVAVPPFPLDSWLLAPAMRLDLVVRAPAEGAAAEIIDRRLPDEVRLVRLIGTGPATQSKPFNPAPLRAGRIPEPNLSVAERVSFVFAAAGSDTPALSVENTPEGFFVGSLCLSAEKYWTINDSAWPAGDRGALPPPLAVLRRGGSYVFSLRNADQLMHPIHIHGHTFKVLRSDRRRLPVHHADTVLLTPGETIEVAFVADNPGRWMFHCHVIEHQKTGMMGYLEVV
jgi:FtsP/CotA-like multicopper oxidase with cupredoxin domain